MTALQRSNFNHIYGDVIWYGVLHGTAIAFLNVYAARLGATPFQIAFITSAPAVVNLLLSLPMARWLEQRPLHGPVYRSGLYHRLPYFLMATLPLCEVALQSGDLDYLTIEVSSFQLETIEYFRPAVAVLMRIAAMRQSLLKQQSNSSVRVVYATQNLLAPQSPEN